jgi:DNA gyrase subunit A
VQVSDDDELMLISDAGTLVRTTTGEVSISGRDTQGVRLIRLGEGERLVQLARIESMGEVDDDDATADDGDAPVE